MQEYKNYAEFDKEISSIYENLLNNGPKLFGAKTKYLELLRRMQHQGA
jgi:hypothetical protein